MNDIRKISVGKNYPDGAIHYQVGKNMNLAGKSYVISDILVNQDLLQLGVISYDIYLVDSEVKLLWKSIIDVPVIVEYNIDFD